MIYPINYLRSFSMSLSEQIDRLKQLLDEFDNFKLLLTEILALLKKNADNNIEAAAAKIITELKATILDCSSNKETAIIPTQGNKDKGKSRYRYSYPNHDVGNEELGTGKNPNSMTWPFGSIPDKKV